MGFEPRQGHRDVRDVRDEAATADQAVRRDELRRRAHAALAREVVRSQMEAVPDGARPPGPPTAEPAPSPPVIGWYRGAPVYADDPARQPVRAAAEVRAPVIVGHYRGAPIYAPGTAPTATPPGTGAVTSPSTEGVGARLRAWRTRRATERPARGPAGAVAGLVAPSAAAAEELRVLSERYADGDIDVTTYAHATAALLGLA